MHEPYIGVVKVVECAEGEGGEGPDRADSQLGDQGAAEATGRLDVVHGQGFKPYSTQEILTYYIRAQLILKSLSLTPMRVHHEEGAEDGIGHRVGPDEGDDKHGDLHQAEATVNLPLEDVVVALHHRGSGDGTKGAGGGGGRQQTADVLEAAGSSRGEAGGGRRRGKTAPGHGHLQAPGLLPGGQGEGQHGGGGGG